MRSVSGRIATVDIAIKNARKPLLKVETETEREISFLYFAAAVLSALRECMISTAYAAEGLNTTSTQPVPNDK